MFKSFPAMLSIAFALAMMLALVIPMQSQTTSSSNSVSSTSVSSTSASSTTLLSTSVSSTMTYQSSTSVSSTSVSSTSLYSTTTIPYVIYNLELNSIPTAQISFNGINYLVPNSISVSAGNYLINALTLGNFIFSNWLSSNSLNASIANVLIANTMVTISGNAIITANFNALTTFYETGLPSGTTWNITFNGNTSNAIAPNSISFITAPDQYYFQVANQVVGSNTFVPYPANRLVYTGNSIAINFSSTSTTTVSSSTTTIPSVALTLSVNPTGAGSIIFSGNAYQSNVIAISQGNYPIEAVPANGFQFLSWQSSGGVLLQTNTYSTNAIINSSGSITALFIPVIAFVRAGNHIGGNVSAVNKHARIKLSGSRTLHSIDIEFNTNKIQHFSMNITISNSSTSNFYKVINISENNSEIDSYVSQAIYNFSVPVSFVKAHGISNGNIELFKQVNNSLVPLPTTYTGTNGTYYFYSAISNSLSAYKVGFASSSTTGTAFPLHLTLPHGFPTYFWTAGVLTSGAKTASVTYNWTNSSVASSVQSKGGPASQSVANVSVGFSTSATGTVDPDSLEIALAGIGANVIYSSNGINGYIYTTNTPQGTSFSLPYDVHVANSFVILLGSSANNTLSSITYPTGCKQLVDTNGGTTTTVFIANCTQSSGSYTLTVKASKFASIALAAYVFPPYNVILEDNPNTAKITTNGNTYANGSVIQVIGTNGITAIKPTTGNWVFNSWSVSDPANLIIANTLAPSTSLTVMGNGTITATWNGITKFYETGLPSGATWSVTYNGISNSSTSNMISFSTLPDTYSFTIPAQTINGVPYEPTPSSGSLYSGNAIAITFKPFSVSISPPSNAVVDAGQYESFTATVYNGISPYTYNILVVNSITPAVITHNDLVSGSSATTLTYTFQTTSADVSNSPEEANVVVTDSFPATVNSIYSSTFTINPAMTTPSISPTNPATYSPGSTVTFSTSFTGGTPPYTYNWLVANSITGVLLANALYTGVSLTSNSFAWTIPSADNGNTVVANVIVTDSASTHVTVNSTKSGVITISSATCTISLNPTSINFGSLNPGASITTTNAIIDSNTGTANAYMFVYGGNWIGPAQFGVSNTTWSKSSGTAFATANKLLSTPVNTTLIVPASGSNTIYFGLGVPGGAPSGAYSQTITIENSC
jgi:PGF-pre-PGF domain-containing protein